jgi:hypothetical protein
MADIEAEVIEQPELEEIAEPEQDDANVNDVSEAEDTGLVVEIGGDGDDDEGAPEWVKNVRRENRELKKRIKEIEVSKATFDAPALPVKPTLEDCDYDAQAFEEKLTAWYDAKREHDAREAESRTVQEKAEQRWQQKLSFYDEGKEKLGAQDYEDAEATVAEIFAPGFPGIMADDVRLGIIKQGAKDPAALVYALGKNPAKAKELAAIDDPVEFAWKAATLEAGMKVMRGKAPPPEKRIGGAVPGVAGALDNTLERLREEAAKTGDFSKVMAYKRMHKG